MEQANKIPDKLMPQEIKEMLDVAGYCTRYEAPYSLHIRRYDLSATDAMGANAAVFSISTFPIKKLFIK